MANDAGCPSLPPRTYSPEILPLLQALLAALADIDVAHQQAVKEIEGGPAEEGVKRMAIEALRECHRAGRAPYVRQLEALEERIKAMAA